MRTVGTAFMGAALLFALWSRRRFGHAGWPLSRFEVRDWSMYPTLVPGDRLLIWRWRLDPGTTLRPGHIVVVRDPEVRGRFLVKRVAQVTSKGAHHSYVLLGDNVQASRDSRAFGPVHYAALEGIAVWRYLPAHRRGKLDT